MPGAPNADCTGISLIATGYSELGGKTAACRPRLGQVDEMQNRMFAARAVRRGRIRRLPHVSSTRVLETIPASSPSGQFGSPIEMGDRHIGPWQEATHGAVSDGKAYVSRGLPRAADSRPVCRIAEEHWVAHGS